MKKQIILSIVLAMIAMCCGTVEAENWIKHVIMEQGHCNTAVALDANGDEYLDVIASFNGRVSLFVAPDWRQETVLHRFASGSGCIHSAVIDADGDGDLDLLNAGRGSKNVVWYENRVE